MGQSHWEEFSTLSVASRQRVNRWNDFGSETLCKLTVDPEDRDTFNATLSRIEFGPLGLIRMRSTGATAYAESGGSGDWGAAERDALLLILPQRGFSEFRHNHFVAELGPGDLTVRDLAGSWVHSCHQPMDILMLKIPYSILLPLVPDPSRIEGMVLRSKNPTVAMSIDVLRAIDRMLHTEPEAGIHDALADMALTAVQTLYTCAGAMAECPSGRHKNVGVRRDAKTYILRNIQDPELSVAMVADEIGVSTRGLQRAFLDSSETPSQYILEQRLDLAARQLSRAGGHTHGSVFEIALSAGFNDASHFCRAFSRRYGVSPRSYRGSRPI